MSKNMWPIDCQICGKTFLAKGTNARYCPVCAPRQKQLRDHARYQRQRRIQLEEKARFGLPPELVGSKYDDMYRKELGLAKYYYHYFRKTFPKIYRAWIISHAGLTTGDNSAK